MEEFIFVIIAFAAGLLSSAGLFFWLYWPATLYLTQYARTSRCTPGVLFVTALISQVVAVFAMVCAGMVPVAGVLLGLLLSAAGFVGWIVIGVLRYVSRKDVQAFLAARPLPKLQCSMLDIYLAVFFFAVMMAFQTAGRQWVEEQGMEGAVVALAAYFILATGLGFFAALDVARRARKPCSPRRRLLSILGILLAFSLSGVVPALIAWRAWQKALQNVGMEEWRKSRLPPPVKPQAG